MKKRLLSTVGGAILAAGIAASGTAQAEGELNVLTWEGYTDPSFV